MPDPNGDGHGTPTSNVASVALTETAAISDSVQSHGAEAGIIIVGGNSASPDGGSFWDQAASHLGSAATAGLGSAAAPSEGSAIHAVAFESSSASAHDFSSTADTGLHAVALDHGAAHADFASMAHYETPSLAGGEFGTQLHV
jgi:hypothetical protein